MALTQIQITVLQNIEQALVRAQRIMGVLGDGSFTVPDTGSQTSITPTQQANGIATLKTLLANVNTQAQTL